MTVGDLKISQATVVSPPAYIDRLVTPVINSLFGFDAAGLPVTITIGANLTLVGNELSATGGGGGGSGTVTSVAVGDLAPLFTSSVATPTVAASVSFALSTQTANRIFAGPASGAVATPTFRALVAADIPNLTAVYATVGAIGSSGLTMNTARLLGRQAGGAGAIEEISIGAGLSFAGGILAATDAGGTVTIVSVAAANGITGTVANDTTTPAITIVLGAITPTSVNGLTISSTSGTLTITNGKTLSISNTLAFAGTDGSTLNIGNGGTLGTAAFTAASAYEVPLTFTTGLTRTTNTVTVNTTQNIAKLSNLTSNGFVKTTGGDGTLSIDTSTYLTGNQTITLSGDATGSGATAITVAVVKINGVSLAGLSTGILKNTTITGAPSIAVAADFPTLNQSTTGSAATLTTPRAIYGNVFDGSAALTQVIASTFGGTGNGFTKFSGPTTAERTFTLPDASATILTDNAVVTGAQGGTGVNNNAKTITIGGSITFSGAFTTALTVTANTSVTLPTSGTLATLAGAEALSNKTITASTFSGTSISVLPTGATNAIVINQVSTATTYGVVSLNNVVTGSGYLGMVGGGGSDSNLYISAPTGGEVRLNNGGSTVVSVTANGITVTTLSPSPTNPIALRNASDATTYGILSFNGAVASGTMVGLLGGGGSDTNLYLRASTAGLFRFSVAGATIGEITATGLNGTPVGATTPSTLSCTTLLSSTSQRFSNLGAGALTTDASGNITVTSDERLKLIHHDFARGIESLRGIRPIVYSWTKESGFDTVEEYTGFSAQNVRDHIPEAIGIMPCTKMLTLSDRPILATVVNSIIDLDARVTALEKNKKAA